MTVKLSNRLQTLINMISTPYDHIWDTCCDHGQLGAALLEKSYIKKTSDENAMPIIHFVDIQPNIIQALKSKLDKYYHHQSERYQTHSLCVSELPLAHDRRHLVIIAGVGGDLVSEFIATLDTLHPDFPIDYLLCPVRHLHQVRVTLKHRNFYCLDEKLVIDNKRFYECLLVSRHRAVDMKNRIDSSPISLIGEQLWESATTEITKAYVKQQITHYSNVVKSVNASLSDKELLTLYQQLNQQLDAQPKKKS
jgi:tRNA (adenine22-N1)-methyltransferase